MMPVLKNNIDDILQEIKLNYDFLMQRNKNLKEENELLKSEQYKDKELQRLKSELDHEGSKLSFYISDKGKKKRDEFIESHKCARGISCHYEFYPTGIGDVVYYVCGCGKKVIIEEL